MSTTTAITENRKQRRVTKSRRPYVPKEYKLSHNQRQQFLLVVDSRPDWSTDRVLELCQDCDFDINKLQEELGEELGTWNNVVSKRRPKKDDKNTQRQNKNRKSKKFSKGTHQNNKNRNKERKIDTSTSKPKSEELVSPKSLLQSSMNSSMFGQKKKVAAVLSDVPVVETKSYASLLKKQKAVAEEKALESIPDETPILEDKVEIVPEIVPAPEQDDDGNDLILESEAVPEEGNSVIEIVEDVKLDEYIVEIEAEAPKEEELPVDIAAEIGEEIQIPEVIEEKFEVEAELETKEEILVDDGAEIIAEKKAETKKSKRTRKKSRQNKKKNDKQNKKKSDKKKKSGQVWRLKENQESSQQEESPKEEAEQVVAEVVAPIEEVQEILVEEAVVAKDLIEDLILSQDYLKEKPFNEKVKPVDIVDDLKESLVFIPEHLRVDEEGLSHIQFGRFGDPMSLIEDEEKSLSDSASVDGNSSVNECDARMKSPSDEPLIEPQMPPHMPQYPHGYQMGPYMVPPQHYGMMYPESEQASRMMSGYYDMYGHMPHGAPQPSSQRSLHRQGKSKRPRSESSSSDEYQDDRLRSEESEKYPSGMPPYGLYPNSMYYNPYYQYVPVPRYTAPPNQGSYQGNFVYPNASQPPYEEELASGYNPMYSPLQSSKPMPSQAQPDASTSQSPWLMSSGAESGYDYSMREGPSMMVPPNMHISHQQMMMAQQAMMSGEPVVGTVSASTPSYERPDFGSSSFYNMGTTEQFTGLGAQQKTSNLDHSPLSFHHQNWSQ